MSLILAINLTDKIILATDSKISKRVNDERRIVGYCTKLVQYNDQVLDADKVVKTKKELGNFISCMFAGDKNFSLFIHNRLSNAFETGELSTDINITREQVTDFFTKIVPQYSGSKKCLIIFAGNSSKNIKSFSFKRLSEIIGPEAGSLEDANIAGAMQFVSEKNDTTPLMNINTKSFLPDQVVFSFEIDEMNHKFGIGKVGGTYSIVAGGSTLISKDLEDKILRYFLSRRDIKAEASDIINFIRNNFSDTIGGAVVLGTIGLDGGLHYVGYQLNRTGNLSDKNWSLEIDDKKFLAIDPHGEKIDLIDGFFKNFDGGNCDI